MRKLIIISAFIVLCLPLIVEAQISDSLNALTYNKKLLIHNGKILTLSGSTIVNPALSLTFQSDQTPLNQHDLDFRFPVGNQLYVNWGNGDIDTISGLGNSIYVTATSSYAITGDYTITITGDLDSVTYVSWLNEPNLSGDLSQLDDLRQLQLINMNNNTSLSGDVTWSNLRNLRFIYLNGVLCSGSVSNWYLNSNLIQISCVYTVESSLTGDITNLNLCRDLTIVRFELAPITGSVVAWDLPVLNTLNLYNASVTCILDSLHNMPSLTYMNLRTDNLTTGDFSTVSSFTAATFFKCNTQTGVTGDFSDFTPMVNLTVLYVYLTDITYTTTTLPAWSNASIRAYSCGFTSTEVDNILIDLAAAGGVNGTIELDGTNAARTAASDAAVATLTGNGWTVTTN